MRETARVHVEERLVYLWQTIRRWNDSRAAVDDDVLRLEAFLQFAHLRVFSSPAEQTRRLQLEVSDLLAVSVQQTESVLLHQTTGLLFQNLKKHTFTVTAGEQMLEIWHQLTSFSSLLMFFLSSDFSTKYLCISAKSHLESDFIIFLSSLVISYRHSSSAQLVMTVNHCRPKQKSNFKSWVYTIIFKRDKHTDKMLLFTESTVKALIFFRDTCNVLLLWITHNHVSMCNV